ncbi:unnamed protein product [Urochloa decumbens]|uniref:Uncharacterized protein n=1 Tax=Urochloa decumbens TaxID=240449 RepID=A0ABC9B096_9POAL
MNQMNQQMSVEQEENLTSRSSVWVVDMQNMLADTNTSEEMARWEKVSVYRVPEWIKRLTKNDNFLPHVVSLGPFHHGKPELLPMEEHKRRAVLHMARRSGKPVAEFAAAIEDVADELQSCYLDLDGKWRGAERDRFVEMMVADGCFLLEMARTRQAMEGGPVVNDYATNDPVYSDGSVDYLWALVRTDMVLVENQLPLLVLQKLEAVHRGTLPGAGDINRLVLFLLKREHDAEGISIDKLGLHPLDLYHKSFCGPEQELNASKEKDVTMPSAVELAEAGVKFKKSLTKSVCDVGFKDGILSMPGINVNNQMPRIFLNLMAFEWLHPNCRKDVTTYIFFMDNVINSSRDVALLRHRRNGIIENFMSSDKLAAALFSEMSKISRMHRNSKLAVVQREVRDHFSKPWNKWRASFVQTHLSNPFVFISLVVATILLIATILQTAYAILSFYTGH